MSRKIRRHFTDEFKQQIVDTRDIPAFSQESPSANQNLNVPIGK